jgi:hypothetical protein
MLANPRGWKARELRAKTRDASLDRQHIREQRRRLMQGDFEPQPQAHASVDEADERNEREELIAELKAAGMFVPPKIKTETLRKKVQEVRDGNEE